VRLRHQGRGRVVHPRLVSISHNQHRCLAIDGFLKNANDEQIQLKEQFYIILSDLIHFFFRARTESTRRKQSVVPIENRQTQTFRSPLLPSLLLLEHACVDKL